jgi:hypothetical protein
MMTCERYDRNASWETQKRHIFFFSLDLFIQRLPKSVQVKRKATRLLKGSRERAIGEGLDDLPHQSLDIAREFEERI